MTSQTYLESDKQTKVRGKWFFIFIKLIRRLKRRMKSFYWWMIVDDSGRLKQGKSSSTKIKLDLPSSFSPWMACFRHAFIFIKWNESKKAERGEIRLVCYTFLGSLEDLIQKKFVRIERWTLFSKSSVWTWKKNEIFLVLEAKIESQTNKKSSTRWDGMTRHATYVI